MKNDHTEEAAGYLGMGATVVLGLIALRFSFKTEERKRIEELQKININSIKFYDMHEGVVPSEMRYDDIKKCRFLLKIELSGENSSYEYQVDKVWWGACGEDYSNSDPKALSNCKAYVENAALVTLYVYFDEFEAGSGEEKDGENAIMLFFFPNRTLKLVFTYMNDSMRDEEEKSYIKDFIKKYEGFLEQLSSSGEHGFLHEFYALFEELTGVYIGEWIEKAIEERKGIPLWRQTLYAAYNRNVEERKRRSSFLRKVLNS